MGKIDDYINALKTLGDGRYHYYDGRTGGIGCSEYTRQALIRAGIIDASETFHAASGNPGVLNDTTRFQKIPWSPSNLQRGDILWSNGHHVATWAGDVYNSLYEAAPESTHSRATCGTGVGLHLNHGYYNCGTGTFTWSCIYRIIDVEKHKEEKMDYEYNLATLIDNLPTIQMGSANAVVKGLQLILKKYGWYADEIDGMCGKNTVAGIKLLQVAMNVGADGICGRKTWTAILKKR